MSSRAGLGSFAPNCDIRINRNEKEPQAAARAAPLGMYDRAPASIAVDAKAVGPGKPISTHGCRASETRGSCTKIHQRGDNR